MGVKSCSSASNGMGLMPAGQVKLDGTAGTTSIFTESDCHGCSSGFWGGPPAAAAAHWRTSAWMVSGVFLSLLQASTN